MRSLRSWTASGGMLVLTMLAGCLSFEHGVVDRALPNDVRLVGVWGAGNDPSIAVIVETGPTTLRIDFFDRRKCVWSPREYIMATRTDIAGQNYLELTLRSSEEAEKALVGPFMAYRFDDHGRLTFAYPDADAFRRAVESGALPGTVEDPKDAQGHPVFREHGAEIHVTASTAQLRAWLARHPEAMQGNDDRFSRLDAAPATLCGWSRPPDQE